MVFSGPPKASGRVMGGGGRRVVYVVRYLMWSIIRKTPSVPPARKDTWALGNCNLEKSSMIIANSATGGKSPRPWTGFED